MSTRNAKNRVRIMPLLLAFQMLLPAQALAQEDSGTSSGTGNANKMSKAADWLKVAGNMGQQFMQAYQMRSQQAQTQAARQQMMTTLGVKPVDPSQVPPIISQNGCMVLQARSEQISSNMSCQGQFDINLMNSGHYDALLSVAEQNVNSLENFLTKGHERFTTQGIGCYDKARNQLNQQLKGRLEMLEQMKESIENRIQLFNKLAERDLKDIKKGDALLNGTKGAGKDIQGLMKDFKWEDKFKDPQCKSLALANFNAAGSKGGFREIAKTMEQTRDKMGAQNFLDKKNQIQSEIIDIAQEAERQVRRADEIPKAGDVLGGIRTRAFSTSAASLVQSFDIVATKAKNRREDMEKKLSKKLGGEESLIKLAQTVKTDNVDIDKALYEWEKATKNKCLQAHFKDEFGSVDNFLGKLEDPNISKKANREADSAFKNYLQKVLGDDRYTVEEKMKMVAQMQSKSNYSRYGMVTGRSFTVSGKQVGASTRLRANDIIGLFANNCRAEFDYDDRSGGSSGRAMVKALKTYAVEYKNEKLKFAADLRGEIMRGLIDCPDQAAVGKAANSCAEKSTDINSPGFCVKTANTCAANAVSCLSKANEIVKVTKAEQKKVVDRYRTNMDKLKADLIAEFKMVKGNFENASRQLDGLFQFGTTYEKDEKPLSEQFELNFTTKELVKGIDESLEVEDPEAYRAKVVKNIDALKKQLEGHNKQILAGFDKEIEKYTKNYKAQLKEWSSVAKSCRKKVTNEYARFVEETNRKATEEANKANEKIVEACNQYKNFQETPCPGGSGSEFGSLGNDIAAIAASSNDQVAAAKIRSVIARCDAFSNENGGNRFAAQDMGDGMSLKKFCTKTKAKEEPECKAFMLASEIDPFGENCKPVTDDEGNSTQKCKSRYKDYKQALDDARELLSEYKQYGLKEEAGEIRVAACDGMNNSDPSMPDFSNPDSIRDLASKFLGPGAMGN